MHLLRFSFEEPSAPRDKERITVTERRKVSSLREEVEKGEKGEGVKGCRDSPGEHSSLVLLVVFHIVTDMILSAVRIQTIRIRSFKWLDTRRNRKLTGKE